MDTSASAETSSKLIVSLDLAGISSWLLRASNGKDNRHGISNQKNNLRRENDNFLYINNYLIIIHLYVHLMIIPHPHYMFTIITIFYLCTVTWLIMHMLGGSWFFCTFAGPLQGLPSKHHRLPTRIPHFYLSAGGRWTSSRSSWAQAQTISSETYS